MNRKTAALTLLGVLTALGVLPVASAGGTAAPPRVHAFSPAVVRPGGDFLIDAEFAGSRPPVVWVGERRLSPGRVRVARDTDGSGVRRILARIPAHMPAGDHVLKIATRAGTSKAATRIVVASCNKEPVEPVEPPDCDAIPADGVYLTVTGAGGYSEVIRQAHSVEPFTDGPRTNYRVCTSSVPRFCFSVAIDSDPGTITAGPLPAVFLQYEESSTFDYWQLSPSSVRVVDVSATRVKVCVDAVLPAIFEEEPREVTVKGWLVFTR